MSFSCSTQQSCSTKSFNHTVLILTASGFEVQFSTWLLQESQWQSHDPAQLQLPALVAALVVKPDSQAPGCLGASQYISIWMSASANQWQISHFFSLFSRGSRYLSHATSIRDHAPPHSPGLCHLLLSAVVHFLLPHHWLQHQTDFGCATRVTNSGKKKEKKLLIQCGLLGLRVC